MIKVYKTKKTLLAEKENNFYFIPELNIDDLFQNENFDIISLAKEVSEQDFTASMKDLQAPIGSQEVWAAGVTYHRSRDARMQESIDKGGDSFYDRVYDAPRPELFFKGNAYRIRAHGEAVHIRKDSKWNVPEPELTLCIAASGEVIGYTIGNDVSSRDIEGENPLYLPQAKTYDGSAALGPCLLLTNDAFPKETGIEMQISRGGNVIFEGFTDVGTIKRSFEELVEYLFRECSFPNGCFLMTGTGIIPPDEFTLNKGDLVMISIDPIGVLKNTVD